MKLAGIEYHGSDGTTQSCLDAIARLYQAHERIESAQLLSANNRHGFLVMIDYGRVVAIKTGFASGYPGEGPRGLASALRFFDRLNVPITEHPVANVVLARLNASALTVGDLEKIGKSRAVPRNHWRDYTYQFDLNDKQLDMEFQELFSYEVPMRIVDLRILDLALQLLYNPDAVLLSGYRRLEDAVRSRCALDGEQGARLFSKAFQGNDSVLCWPDLDQSENDGRASLFTAVFRAFRNTRAHKEQSHTTDSFLREFLLLNELFRLESSSKPRAKNAEATFA